MRIANQTLISSPVDLSTTWTSNAIWLGHIYNYSIQLTFSDDPEGTFYLQCSDDMGAPSQENQLNTEGVVNWTDIIGSNQEVSESGDHTWTAGNVGYAWVRVLWIPTSPQGQLDTARFNIKGA